MTFSDSVRVPARRTPKGILAGLLVLVAAGVATPHYDFLTLPTSRAASRIDTPASDHRGPRRDHGDPPGVANGAVPDGTTAFDDDVPGVANLDPALLGALRRAAGDAADDGFELYVTSGWRSPGYQSRLLRDAVAEFGSAKEAARWVATADTSAHVSGDAVDIGPSAAAGWLSKHGAEYGLCQIYGNEPWHYELRPKAVAHGCPRMYADPTRDPRMQQ